MDHEKATADAEPVPDRPLGLELSDAVAQPVDPAREELARPEATPLTADETARLLARLPAEVTPAPLAPEGFALRDASLPPPRTGRTITEPFPPSPEDGAPARPAAGTATTNGAAPSPLQVARFTPDGEVVIAPGVSITFSKPMVALDSVAAAVSATPPARLDPQPAGEWRWADTRTLVFVPDGERMPAATAYTVEVPATARAADGSTLATPAAWTFATPAPTLIVNHPEGGPVRPTTPIALAFDQAVDATAILERLEVTTDRGRNRVALRLATPDEIAADPASKRITDAHPSDRTVVVVPAEPLPSDARVTVTVPAGTPVGRRPARDARRAGLDLPHARALPRPRAPCRLARVPPRPGGALDDRVHEPAGPGDRGRRDRGDRSTSGLPGARLWDRAQDQPRGPGQHHVPRDTRRRPARRVRPGAR